MKLNAIPPRYKKRVINSPENNDGALEIPQLEIVLWLCDR